MTIGTSIVLIAIGAILKYAVDWEIEGLKLDIVGVILMIVGIIGLILSLLYTFFLADRYRDRDRVVEREREVPAREVEYRREAPPRDRF